jgi:hypothetical protein
LYDGGFFLLVVMCREGMHWWRIAFEMERWSRLQLEGAFRLLLIVILGGT